jgi:hypothetical protein
VVQKTSHVLAGRYELGPVLGQGGMARVHKAVDRQLGRPVAVKVLAPPFDRDRAFVERFRREARAAAGLSHPNIVAVFDSGSDDGTHYIVTELAQGETLAERLRRDGSMPPQQVVDVAVDVCRALTAAHERGLIHRDVKPGNVMLLEDGRVKVVDFGIARAAGSDTLTGTGVVMGSTAYLSPEQASGGPVDERSDLYSLGCVLFEMLTGQVPFRADTPVATMYRHVNEEPPRPSSIAPVPAGLEDVVMRCLEKDPKRRFGSAAELERALLAVPLATDGDTQPLAAVGAAADETRPIQVATRPSRPRRRVPRWMFAVAGVVLLVGLVAFAIAATSHSLRPRAEARAAARDAAENALPPETPPSFATAWSHLLQTIASAQATGGIDDGTADELARRAQELLDAYRDEDPEALANALSDLDEELAKAIDEGRVSPTAADAIDAAILDVALALDSEGALTPGTSEAPTGPTGEEVKGPGKGHGPGDGPGKGHGDKGHGNDD